MRRRTATAVLTALTILTGGQGAALASGPGISVSPDWLHFGHYWYGDPAVSRTTTITSTGTTPLVVYGVTLDGDNPGDFTLVSDGCTGVSLAPGSSCQMTWEFVALGVYARIAYGDLASNAGNTLLTFTGYGDDGLAPVSTIDTPGSSVLLPGQTITGGVTDHSAIQGLQVVFELPVAAVPLFFVPATLSCDSTGTSCSWSAAPPLVPGVYTAYARGMDVYGNTESPGPSITVVVV